MRVAVRVFNGLRTLLVGAVLSVAMQGTATSRLEGQQERRWGGPEIGLNLALGLGRGRFHDFVKAAGGFGAYGTLPIALRGGLAARSAGYRTHRSEEHTSELQSRFELVCRLL